MENITSIDSYTVTITNDGYGITEEYTPKLYVWKLWQEAYMPEYGSEWAACFDLKASLRDEDKVTVYTKNNVKEKRSPYNKSIPLCEGERMLVPTGLIFDLNKGTSLRIHPRSGLSLKHGIIVANCEGIVDADYVHQTYVMLQNVSTETFEIGDGMRIAQAELVPIFQREIVESDMEPEEKTSRNGGFGSTGL